METAVAGVILVTIARLLTYLFGHYGVVSNLARARWHEFAPIDFSGTGAAAFGLGVVLPFIANLFFPKKSAQDWAIHHYGSNLLRLLHTATKYEMLVSLTLDNRKVYVGFVITAPNLQSNDLYVQLLPVLSGYRDANDLRLKFTTNYAQVYPEAYVSGQMAPPTLWSSYLRPASGLQTCMIHISRTSFSMWKRSPKNRSTLPRVALNN